MQTDHGKIHVLHIPRWYPHRGDPMLGLFVRNHIESLPASFHSSVLYLQFIDAQENDLFIDHRYVNGIFTCTAYIRKATMVFAPVNAIINLYHYFAAFRQCYRLICHQQGKPVLTHVHVLTRTGLLALLIKVANDSPYVITEHWTRYLVSSGTYRGFVRKFLTRIVVRYSGAIVPVTANLRDAMIARGLTHRNYVVIPNVVNVNKFKPAAKTPKRSRKVLVHLSCFTDRQKNISGILRIIKKLSERRTDFLLKLIGDGEDFDQMKELAESLQLTGSFVIFTGLKQDEELVRLLSNSDLMIMFSNYENLPVVILESYACGVPVISTRVGGIHEHLHSGLGILVEPQDEEQFLEALTTFLDNPDVYNKEEIRNYAVRYFSREAIGSAYAQVYRDVLALH